jgi:hypothetical protein
VENLVPYPSHPSGKVDRPTDVIVPNLLVFEQENERQTYENLITINQNFVSSYTK